MSELKYVRFVAVAVIFLFMPHIEVRAQDDETPEQKKVMQTLMERERMAVEAHAGNMPYPSLRDGMMDSKERSRAGVIREEERDVTSESGGYGGYWW